MAAKVKTVRLTCKSKTKAIRDVVEVLTRPSPAKLVDKYPKICAECKSFTNLVKIFCNLVAGYVPEPIGVDLKNYSATLMLQFDKDVKTFSVDAKIADIVKNSITGAGVVKRTPAEDRAFKAMVNAYLGFKESETIRSAILVCSNLSNHKDHIRAGDMKFLTDSTTPIRLLPVKFDFAAGMRAGGTVADAIKTAVPKLMKFTYSIFNLLTSSDSDPEAYVQALSRILGDMESKLPKCARAFEAIRQSMGRFEINFDKYARQMYITKNPMTMFESCVADFKTTVDEKDTGLNEQLMSIIRELRASSAKISGAASMWDGLFGDISKSKISSLISKMDESGSQQPSATASTSASASTPASASASTSAVKK